MLYPIRCSYKHTKLLFSFRQMAAPIQIIMKTYIQNIQISHKFSRLSINKNPPGFSVLTTKIHDSTTVTADF